LYAVFIVRKSSALGRTLGAGLVAAAIVAVGGRTLERVRFGASDQDAIARVEAEIGQRFHDGEASLATLTGRAAAQIELIRAAPRDPAAAARLFDALDDALQGNEAFAGVTVYDAGGTPLAWAGRVGDPPQALKAAASLVLTVGAFGPRLVRIEPIIVPPATRLATVVAEQILEPIDRAPSLSDRFVLNSTLAPVTLRIGAANVESTAVVFSIASRDGAPLVQAQIAPEDLVNGRARWRRLTGGIVLFVAAVTFVLCAGLLVDVRRRSRTPRSSVAAAGGIVALLLASRLVLAFATTQVDAPPPIAESLGLLWTSLLAVASVWLGLDLIESRRLAHPRVPLVPRAGRITLLAAYAACGLVAALITWSYSRFLRGLVLRTTVDLLHFSLHPLDALRLDLIFALVLLAVAVIWAAAATSRLPSLWRRPPRGAFRSMAIASWGAGALLGVLLIASMRDGAVPPAPVAFALMMAGICGAALPILRARARHVSQSMRLAGLFLAILIPGVATYPLLSSFAVEAKERLIADQYGSQVLTQRQDLQQRLVSALEQIDALEALPDLVTAPADDENGSRTSRAFVVWSQSELQRFRLTSAVELYGSNGQRLSRFALILPESAGSTYRPTGCDWDLSDDVQPAIRATRSPIGANESHVLRASRGVCVNGRIVGGIIVRAMLDYRTLPFISARSPYLESLRPDASTTAEGIAGRDVEFVFYGWSRAPLFASGTTVWTLPDDVFEQMAGLREAVWARVERDAAEFRVHFLNDRGGIYALGYPVTSAFGHLINLAELVFLALLLVMVLIAGATLFNAVFARTPTSGRALFREIRSSYYRKLRLVFVFGSIVPVVILALFARTYFANELTAGLEEAAARTATVAQRLVEDYATLQQRGAGGLDTLNDDIIVLVSRAIDEDVNLFDRARLQATSALDLYASQLLSTRTPADVYRRIVLERAPTYVGQQEVGTVRYLVAAAPVRTPGREGIVTIPVTLRPLEIEQQIDDLDRRVLFATVLFSLLGGALGYWMAERIADPVNRLTRATRRIAHGDLDARIAATSADELGRLVRDFNQMAADLQRQRTELEHTQRLEAWADMARQVAHDIKNPLTPIQLSAEHARRLNIDRGRPLSPALDECITAILGQVRLLRQIAAEFSSFASSPTAHVEPTDLPALVEEVVEPYRVGLADRIAMEVSAPDDLPPVTLDRTLFARALGNIIENALYAMPGKGRLAVDVLAGDGTVDVQVSDTGVGMDADALKKIFEPYFSTKATGTGLGLTIAKRNIELNGGTITVRSERGVGTTVTLRLFSSSDHAVPSRAGGSIGTA
jgi:signal transduction histidine kinase